MRKILACLIVLCLPALALANDWDALEDPDAIVLMRHALAPGTGDPAEFDLEDCGTQRNLDERGRAQARRIGAALKERGVAFDAVWTSQWCRSRETATLMDLGQVTEVPPLNSFFDSRGSGDAQTAETVQKLRDQAGGRLLLVTHQVNITALTGVFPGSGEIIVTQLDGEELAVTGRISIAP